MQRLKTTSSKTAWLLFLLAWSCTAHAEPGLATSTDLDRLMAAGVPVVDVRTRGEWVETGIIEGAHLLTFFDAEGQYNWHGWLANLKEIAGPGEPVVLMCHSGNRSAIIAQALVDQAGYTEVYDYYPGIVGWLGDKRPTVAFSGNPKPP